MIAKNEWCYIKTNLKCSIELSVAYSRLAIGFNIQQLCGTTWMYQCTPYYSSTLHDHRTHFTDQYVQIFGAMEGIFGNLKFRTWTLGKGDQTD